MYRSKNIQRFPTVTNEELPVEKRVRDDDQQRIGGVYRVSTRNGEIAHYSTSWDLQRAKSHNLRQLVLGKHAHHWLQQEYDTTALRGIRFEIVEVVKRPKRKLVLPNIGDIKSDWREGRGRHRGTRKWSHRGGDQVSGNSSAWVGGLPPPESLPVQAFTYDDYEKKLLKKLHYHHVQYLQQRLGVLLQNYNNKQIVPRLRVWQAALYAARKAERSAAATQVQRLYRGRRTRQALWRYKVQRGILTIQCCVRCHQAWVKASHKRWEIVSYFAARVIQRAFQTHIAKGVATIMVKHMRQSRNAREIQRVWRGKLGRARWWHLRLVRAAIKVQCRWRIRKGGLALHLKRQHARQLEDTKQASALTIQCAARQWFARSLRDDYEYEQLIRCAIRIQCRWRIRQGGYALHLKRAARKEEKAYAKQLEQAAIRVQAAWRRKKGQFALHLKRQAQKHMMSEEAHRLSAAQHIQHWWSVITGTYASKLIARSKRQGKKEAKELKKLRELAALRMQSMWRRRQGGLALHLKRQGLAIKKQEASAASRIQMWWHNTQGNFAAQLKARAQVHIRKQELEDAKRLEELNNAALRVQCMWRRRQGQLSYHLKRQAKKYALELELKESKAAHQIQVWWSHVTGGFAAKMKARAKMQLRKEEIAHTAAAHQIQVWWSHVTGGFAAKMKARAKMQLRKEENARNAAVHRIQQWWHLKSGSYAAKMIARAKMQTILEDRSAHKLQLWWHRVNGTFAQRIKERARAEIKEEWRQLESAALRVQARWRCKKGQLSYHLKQKALKRLASSVDDWIKYRDDFTLQDYYYSETLDRTVFFKPDTYIFPGNWYPMVDQESQATYYAKLKEEDAPLWKDMGRSLETEFLEAECVKRGLIGEGLGRDEYIAQLRSWLEDPTSHEFNWDFPPGAELVDTPKVPRPPRTYSKINGYWRRRKRQGLNDTKVYWNKKPNLKKFVFEDLHPHHAELMNRVAFSKRKSQADMREQIAAQMKGEEEESRRLAEEMSRKHVSPLKSKSDLHEYVVKTYARRMLRLQPLKTKHQSRIEKGDRVKIRKIVGGFVSHETVIRYYPGTIIRVRKYEHTETFDILLDDGVKTTGARRDQVLLEFQDEQNIEEEKEKLLFGEDESEDNEEPAVGFAEIANTKKLMGKMLSSIGKLPADDPRNNLTGSRGSTRGSNTSSQDGLHATLQVKLNKKRAEMASRGTIASRASSKPRTPGPT